MDSSPPSRSGGCEGNNTRSPNYVKTGIHTFTVTDLQVPTRGFSLTVNRTYDSSRRIDGLFGVGWTFNFMGRVTLSTFKYSGSTYTQMAAVLLPDGRMLKFTENPDGSYSPPFDRHDVLVENADGSFDFTPQLTRSLYHYASDGSLQSLTDDYGNMLTLNYDGNGRLLTVIDATGSGRLLNITYGGDGRISVISDHTGRSVQYNYNGSGNLTGFTDAALRNTTYSYVWRDGAYLLSRVQDHWARVITNITYDLQGRVQNYTDKGESYTYAYCKTECIASLINTTSKTDSANNTWVFGHNANANVISDLPPSGQGGGTKSYTYNADRSIQMITDETGIKTFYMYNANGSVASITKGLSGVSGDSI